MEFEDIRAMTYEWCMNLLDTMRWREHILPPFLADPHGWIHKSLSWRTLREVRTRMGKIHMRISCGDNRACSSWHRSKFSKTLLQPSFSVLFPLSNSNIQWFAVKHNTCLFQTKWHTLSIVISTCYSNKWHFRHLKLNMRTLSINISILKRKMRKLKNYTYRFVSKVFLLLRIL